MLVVFTVLFACSNAPAPAEPTPEAHEGHEAHAKEAVAKPAPGELILSLNGTEKWKMDDHTREVMAETRKTLAGAKVGSTEDAVALGDALQEQLDRLVQGCTMEGPSHDELHVFLMAWIPEVSGLQKTTVLVGGRARLLRLQQMLHQYDEFFE